MELVNNVVEDINSCLQGIPMIDLLLGTRLFLTFRTGFVQHRTFTGIRLPITRDSDSHGDINQFAVLTTALASTVGTGNIVGMGAAIALGGPGAVLWCWFTDVLGIATKYGGSLIAVKYRMYTKDGTVLRGAVCALERGLGMRWLGITFATLGALISFGIGYGVQVNAISSIVDNNVTPVIMANSKGLKSFLDTYPWSISLTIRLVTGDITCLVIFGGVEFIARVCKRLVLFMAFFYVVGCFAILFINRALLGQTLSVIFRSTFTGVHSIAGDLTGTGIMMSTRYGITRELFSNESGIGSAPIMAATAQTRSPVRQAFVSAAGTFWNAVMVCPMTGLVLVNSVVGHDTINVTSLSGGELTNASFSLVPYIGQPILVVGIITFAYSIILGWSYYGERYPEYLIGKRGVIPYHMTWIAILVAAPVMQLELVWSIADTFDALMAVPNLIAVLLLSGMITKGTRCYLASLGERDSALIPLIGDQGVLPLLKK